MKQQQQNLKENSISIVGRGNSLKGFDFSEIKGDIMCVNTALKDVPEAKYVVFWDDIMYDQIVFIPSKAKRITTGVYPNANRGDIPMWHDNEKKFKNCPEGNIPNINLSGVMAVAAAINLGYKNIYLFGFDGKRSNNSDHYNGIDGRGVDGVYEKFNDDYAQFNEFANIQNVQMNGIDSEIRHIKKITYEQYSEIFRKDRNVTVRVNDVLPDGTKPASKKISNTKAKGGK